jgi:two-component system nitrogen regulation response regulator NtrX
VLETGEVARLGGERTFRVDVRILAATNQRLDQAVAAGTFREDLFFRLNVFPIEIPPLRDRLSDLPDLVVHLARRARRIHTPTFTAEAVEVLMGHSWPGNVRELANIVERLVILPRGGPAAGAAAPAPDQPDHWDRSLSNLLDDYERSLISRALSRANGNVAEAARLLQTDRANLYRRMKRLGIQ